MAFGGAFVLLEVAPLEQDAKPTACPLVTFKRTHSSFSQAQGHANPGALARLLPSSSQMFSTYSMAQGSHLNLGCFGESPCAIQECLHPAPVVDKGFYVLDRSPYARDGAGTKSFSLDTLLPVLGVSLLLHPPRHPTML